MTHMLKTLSYLFKMNIKDNFEFKNYPLLATPFIKQMAEGKDDFHRTERVYTRKKKSIKKK